ncbi:hypothetical protein F8B43_3056 [Methylorubrum populi]|uniref:Uncharacterized protein n=1 Tax=Methylorubrum populi TaxID=223967 RepID=A0A833N0F1_9HYPH|nr:hypothetical protein F8B43_3056 [Methylorubrum populi]
MSGIGAGPSIAAGRRARACSCACGDGRRSGRRARSGARLTRGSRRCAQASTR